MDDVEHSIPDDDFHHIESEECGCNPRPIVVRGFGGAIVHNVMDAKPLLEDTFPEEWTKK